MPKAPEERYMEWLIRVEEEFGLAATQRGTLEIEEARRLLYEELGFEPTESQVSSFMMFGKARYEIMPEIGIMSYRFERPWGYQMVYRDIPTGRFISYPEVTERLRIGWADWGY